MKKRLAAMILAVGMGLFGLVGCSGGGGSDNPPASSEDPGEEEVMYIQAYNENGELRVYGEYTKLLYNEDMTECTFNLDGNWYNYPTDHVRMGQLETPMYVTIKIPHYVDPEGNQLYDVYENKEIKTLVITDSGLIRKIEIEGHDWFSMPTEYITWLNGRPTL